MDSWALIMTKAQKIIYFYTIALTLFFSFFFQDLFPFSLNPLYSKKTEQFSYVSVYDEKGRRLSNEYLGLYLNYDSLFEKAGLKSEPSSNSMGSLLSEKTIRAKLKEKSHKLRGIKTFKVSLKNVTLNREKVPHISEIIFLVQNSHYRGNVETPAVALREDKYFRRIKNKELK